VKKLAAEGIKVVQQENKGLAAAKERRHPRFPGSIYIFALGCRRPFAPRMPSSMEIRILESNPQVWRGLWGCRMLRRAKRSLECRAVDPDRLLVWNYITLLPLYRVLSGNRIAGYDGTMPVQGFEDWGIFGSAPLSRAGNLHYVPEVFLTTDRQQARFDHSNTRIRIAGLSIRWDQARLSIPTGVAGS